MLDSEGWKDEGIQEDGWRTGSARLIGANGNVSSSQVIGFNPHGSGHGSMPPPPLLVVAVFAHRCEEGEKGEG